MTFIQKLTWHSLFFLLSSSCLPIRICKYIYFMVYVVPTGMTSIWCFTIIRQFQHLSLQMGSGQKETHFKTLKFCTTGQIASPQQNVKVCMSKFYVVNQKPFRNAFYFLKENWLVLRWNLFPRQCRSGRNLTTGISIHSGSHW